VTALPFSLRNTLSGEQEPFRPLEPGKIKMYVCGVTPYDVCHLGHARCYVTFDFIRRSLDRLGWAVTHAQNFTDIDDKIINRARERGEDPAALAERYIQDYFDKMDKLNVRRADVYPRVTGHLPQIVSFIGRLVEKGVAYPVGGDVYYEVRKFPSYGKLSKRSVDELKSGARVEVDERKRDPLDFALWKAAKPGEPAWDSPWGKGRPGWHIECSVMSIENLKAETFDIHGGGQDLIFPHHENEIAQAEGATGKTFSRYWIHNGFVTVNKEKMSKSLGNFFSLTDVFARYEPRAVRFFLLGTRYDSPLEFSDDLLAAAAAGLKDVDDTLDRVSAALRTQTGSDKQDEKVMKERLETFEKDFLGALADNFNSPKALAAFFSLLGELKVRTASNRSLSVATMAQAVEAAKAAFRDVLGVPLRDAASSGDEEVEKLVYAREAARKAKDWAEADRLRKELAARNVIVEDTSRGPRWWKKS
jgi:cysteinyl-tRNA synthetase